jgi:hypothetical protein
MAITEAFSTTGATVGATLVDLPTNTTTLTSQTTDGIYQLFLDLNAMTATESYEFKIYEQVTSGSTRRVVQAVTFTGAQTAEPIYVTPALLFLHGWTFSLQRLQGTDRAFSWSIRSVA